MAQRKFDSELLATRNKTTARAIVVRALAQRENKRPSNGPSQSSVSMPAEADLAYGALASLVGDAVLAELLAETAPKPTTEGRKRKDT